jgi:MFS family permease
MDLTLFKIGILYSVREIFNYLFEIPSGMFADNYGKKTELCLCFILYIISFVLFFIGKSYWEFILAMIFFGLGEAFRSGTHKAIILTYLEEKDWFTLKSFVYGRTRSFSLIGSSLSAFVSIIFVLSFNNLRVLFLICIIPYVLDFLLILSYPKRFNERHETELSFKKFIINSFKQLKGISKNITIIKTISSSSIFDAIFKSIKDYIQPVLQMILLTSSVSIIKNVSPEDTLTIYLAVIYGVLYIFSSIASRNVYKLNKIRSSRYLMNISFDIMAFAFLLLALFVKLNAIYIIVPLYFILYILKDARRPLFVDVIGDCMSKRDRVTVLSIESQFKALFLAIFAPLFGLIADKFSISALFLILGVMSFIINRFVGIQKTDCVQ